MIYTLKHVLFDLSGCLDLLLRQKFTFMKKLLLFIVLASTVATSKSQGLHYQWHGGGSVSLYGYRYNTDTMIVPLKVANVSNYNAIGVFNLNTQQWSTTSYSTALSFSATVNPSLVMKNLKEGLCLSNNVVKYATTDFFKTVTTQTATVNSLGATSQGYYGYRNVSGCGICTYSVVFSTDGSSWTTVHTDANAAPVFAKSKNKVYTIHNGILKSSTNGGASYSPINTTYTFNVTYPIEPVIIPLHDDTLFVKTDQLHYSFDNGATWATKSTPTATGSIGQIAAKNGKELMIIDKSMPYNIYYSNNSGTSWTTYTTIPQYYSSNGDKLIASKDWFYLTPHYKSINGNVWEDVLIAAPAPKPYDINFTGNIGLVGIAQGYFGYSTNRGYNYTFPATKIPSNTDVMAVKAIDINKFLVGDRKGQIFISTNQGASWTQKNTSSLNLIPRKFSISQDKNTIVCSRLGMPLMSIDAGTTFSIVSVGGGTHYQTIKPTAGKMVDVGPVLDGSFNLAGWEFSTFDISGIKTVISTVTVNSSAEDMIDIHMVNDNLGYFMTRNTTNNATVVYKTTNGWAVTNTVTTIPTPTTGTRSYDGRYGNIQTFGTDTVIISGSGNPVNNQTNFYHISTDGGLNWAIVYTDFSKPTSLLGNRVYKMVFFNPTEYMALISDNFCGGPQASQGVYLGATSSGTLSTTLNELNFTNSDNSFKVYPNPAHDMLNIDATIFVNSLTPLKVSVTDVVGRLVSSSTVNHQNTQINTSSLKEGIYFLSIEKEGKLYTSKFIKE